MSKSVNLLLAMCLLVTAPTLVGAQNRSYCTAEDDGTGTVALPPAGCAYLSPQEVHMIIDGLPPGTTIELAPIHAGFFTYTREPGGTLGGEREVFESTLSLELTGTGDLAGYTRSLDVPLGCETHVGPRTPGDPVQTFPTDMYQLQGQLLGDPDFTSLEITGGTNFGLPSPGSTTLTQRPNGRFSVDSFFDITYQITFVGAPGGPLDGLSGTTTGTLRMAVDPPPLADDPCIVDDDGTGTVSLPPEGCKYIGPAELHMMIDGLPPGTEIQVDPIHRDFICLNNPCGQPGGSLGGQYEDFDSTLEMQMTGTGTLEGFNRTLEVPLLCETHTGPRTAGDPEQLFATDMYELAGGIAGDPDFTALTVTGGTNNGLPGPGQTTLTDLGDGTFMVDSFFDISYQIDFTGAPGSVLAGMAGTTTGSVGMGVSALRADLAITKDDGVTQAIPGQPRTYTIIASNNGPDRIYNAQVIDTFPAQLGGVTWTCAGGTGGSCSTPSGAGNISQQVTLAKGGSVTFSATGTVNPGATGTLSNTAAVHVGGHEVEADPTNNSATDVDTLTPTADLAVTKTDHRPRVTPGLQITYTITVSNNGPSDITGATVTDTFPAKLSGVSWTCEGGTGTSCTAAGNGNINDTVNLPAGSFVIYTVDATVNSGATGTLTNTATVAVPTSATESQPANNSSTDTDPIVLRDIFKDGFESGNTSVWPVVKP